MENNIRIAKLIRAYLAGQPLSDELRQWIDESDEHKKLFQEIVQGKDLPEKLSFYESLNMKEEWNEWQTVRGVSHSRSKIYLLAMKITAVVALLFILGVSLKYFLPVKPAHESALLVVDGTRITPGHSVAELTRGDYSFVLGESDSLIISEKGVVVVDSFGQHHIPSEAQTVLMNKLTVPRGGEYFIVLEDGTKVWLNSDSELHFPDQFKKTERRIMLTGEAYVEVAKETNRPFYIEAANRVIHVTGTALNVCCYENDETATVTLIHGKVQLENLHGQVLTQLKPAEQAVLDMESEQFRVRTVDVRNVLAWHHGLFIFQNEQLRGIAKQLERWYNVDIQVDTSLSDRRYSGQLSRYETIDPLLKILRSTGELEFVKSSTGGIEIVPIEAGEKE